MIQEGRCPGCGEFFTAEETRRYRECPGCLENFADETGKVDYAAKRRAEKLQRWDERWDYYEED